jgi:hypothetical protein
VEKNASFLVSGRDQVATTTTAMQQCQMAGANDCQVRENICSSAL